MLGTPEARARTVVDGIWQYINPGMRGQGYLIDGHYVFFATFADSTLPPSGALTDAMRVKIHTSMLLDAGTYSVRDTLVTMRREYSKDPRQSGVTWRWSFALKGDIITYHVLDDGGQATNVGRAVRLDTTR